MKRVAVEAFSSLRPDHHRRSELEAGLAVRCDWVGLNDDDFAAGEGVILECVIRGLGSNLGISAELAMKQAVVNDKSALRDDFRCLENLRRRAAWLYKRPHALVAIQSGIE